MKRRTMFIAAAIVAVAGVTVLTSAASASPRGVAATHVRTLAAAQSYLASLGIDARTVVIQRGARNYAGPKCPGAGWTCTTAKRVLQDGGDNKVDCTPGTGSVVGDTQSCTIVQTGSQNSARCSERSSSDAAVQDCNITQSGVRNEATVEQAVEANGGPAQSADKTIEVTQTAAAGGNNDLNVRQHVHQHTEATGGQSQDVHQELTSSQVGAGTGNNSAQVKQDQNQDEHNGVSQAQNTNSGGATPCSTFPASNPNQCANISQTTDAGNNQNRLDQSIDEDAESNVATDQVQGSFSGGINGHVELRAGTGASHNDAKQRKSQTAKGPTGAFQRQIDPMGCCSFSAQGNSRSTETLDQSSTQNASAGTAALQELEIDGSANSPLGSCMITQKARNNSASSNFSGPGQLSPCPFLVLTTLCTSGGGEAPTTGSGSCSAFQGGEEAVPRRR
jgi:hypothetical protein